MFNKTKKSLPVDAVVAVTYRCNSKCMMCDIWKITDHFTELPASKYLELPASLQDVNISGGEPFLRADLPEIVANVKKACPTAKIIISSNGFATELITARMIEILRIDPDIGVAFSLDGDSEMHARVRGVERAFEKTMATIKKLRTLGITNLRISFTANPINISHLPKVYDLSRELGVEFTCCGITHSSEVYFGGKQNDLNFDDQKLRQSFDYLIQQELSTNNPKRWVRAYFSAGLVPFAITHEPPLKSAPGAEYFFLDPAGNIYPSMMDNKLMGNLRNDNFVDIWQSERAAEIRAELRASAIPSWMVCTARTAIKSHPLTVIWWIIRHKIKLLWS